jgi:hypothetical protein
LSVFNFITLAFAIIVTLFVKSASFIKLALELPFAPLEHGYEPQ